MSFRNLIGIFIKRIIKLIHSLIFCHDLDNKTYIINIRKLYFLKCNYFSNIFVWRYFKLISGNEKNDGQAADTYSVKYNIFKQSLEDFIDQISHLSKYESMQYHIALSIMWHLMSFMLYAFYEVTDILLQIFICSSLKKSQFNVRFFSFLTSFVLSFFFCVCMCV